MSDTSARVDRVTPALLARAADLDAAATFPHEDIADLRDAGLLGLMVPASLGGLGAGFEEYVRTAMALAQASPATALLFNMHAAVTGGLAAITDDVVAVLGASDAFVRLRDEILAGAVAGRIYGVAISEAGAGSRLSLLQSTYERATYEPDGDGYRIRGQKSACSGAGHLDGYLVAARGSGPELAVSYFFVPAGPGVVPVGDWDPLGMRATASRGLDLDVAVPSSHLLGGAEGLALPLAYTMPQWLVASYAAVYVGVARAALDAAASLLKGRGDVAPVTRARLGRADADTHAAALVVEHAGRLVDRAPGTPETNEWIYRAKILAGDTAMRVTADLAEACGLGALRRGSPLERLYRDARFGALMPPRSDVCADVLGGARLGVTASDLETPPW